MLPLSTQGPCLPSHSVQVVEVIQEMFANSLSPAWPLGPSKGRII